MEGRTEKASSSSSSLTSELFGSKVNPLPSSSSFRSIFPPPSKVMGRESMQQDTVTAGWNEKSSKIGDDVDRQREEQDNLGSVYQDQRVQPCHLSSSIYYGGPDVYFQSQDSSSNSTENKREGGGDDSGSASRGNWWKGTYRTKKIESPWSGSVRFSNFSSYYYNKYGRSLKVAATKEQGSFGPCVLVVV